MSAAAEPRRGGPRLRRMLAAALIGLGAALLLWSILSVSSAGFGTRPTSSFAQRRAYDQVKRDVHEVFPFALVRALFGLALLVGGVKLWPPAPDHGPGPDRSVPPAL